MFVGDDTFGGAVLGPIGGFICRELQVKFAGRTYDMWNKDDYAAFGKERGDRCAQASAQVAKWVVEMF